MPLILAPSFDEHTREEIEAHLEVVRATRLTAAIEYQVGRNRKLQGEAHKLRLRLNREYEMLRKEIEALNKTEIKVRDRLEKLDNIKNELGLTVDMIEIHDLPEEE